MKKEPRTQESIEELAFRASRRAMDFSDVLNEEDKIKFMDSIISQFVLAREALNKFYKDSSK